MMMWRVFRVDKDLKPRTLFYGFNYKGKRTRKVPINISLQADKGTAGFHVFPSESEAMRYLKRFKDTRNLIVSEVWCQYAKLKPRGHGNVWLAADMRINITDWRHALIKDKRTPGYIAKENLLVYHSLSCACDACLLADEQVCRTWNPPFIYLMNTGTYYDPRA